MAAGAFYLVAGPHPRRELTLMPRRVVQCSRGPTPARSRCGARRLALLARAAGAFHLASARHGRRRFLPGGGAPPPPRTDADASPRRPMLARPHARSLALRRSKTRSPRAERRRVVQLLLRRGRRLVDAH